MKPVLFEVPGLGWQVPGYGLMMMIGFLWAIWWASRRAIRSGGNPDVVLNCGLIAVFAGVIGARIMYVWHNWSQFAGRGSALSIAWAILDVRKGGLEYYGGVVVTIVVVVFYLWRWGHSLRWYLDMMAPSLMLGLAVGRVGCFLNGCCWGGVCEQPWAVRFPYGSIASVEQWQRGIPAAALPQQLLYFEKSLGVPTPISRESLAATDAQIAEAKNRQFIDIRTNMAKYGLSAQQLRELAHEHSSAPVHPAQLYSTVTAGLLALLLGAIYWRRSRDGMVIFLMLVLEPPTRFILEYIRVDNPRDVFGILTISQAIAIVMFVAGVVGLIAIRNMPRRSRRATPWTPSAEGAKAAPAMAQ